ncbi:MAG: protein kinase, partial [Polyangiaceae bacterium]
MFDREGRVRVVDFGLAKDLTPRGLDVGSDNPVSSSRLMQGVQATGRMGTPLYMAPEQWRGDPSTTATDLWALGTILFEMATGSLPYDEIDLVTQALAVCGEGTIPDPLAHGAPERMARIIRDCMAKDPSRRPAAPAVAESLRALLDAPAHQLSKGESPFCGLLPFTETHAPFFVGREVEVDAFLARLRVTPVLPVVGPSASGKTSFLRAGVTARLMQERDWLVLRFCPGRRPLDALAARVVLRDSEVSSERLSTPDDGNPLTIEERMEVLSERLRQNPRILSTELREIVRELGVQVLLHVEQFEECFTLCDDEQERRCFVEGVLSAADDATDPIRVVFTMRHDFLDRLAQWPEGRSALQNVTVLQRPTEQALRDAITQPAAALGYSYDDEGLVDEMVAAVHGVPNGLALLQFTAQAMWAERDKEQLLLLRSTYDKIGGVEGALASHADGVVQGLSLAQQEIARAMLVRLVDDGRARRLSETALLEGVHGDRTQVTRVLRRLTEARLTAVIRAAGEAGMEAQVELAHESLLTSWGTLSEWLNRGRAESAFIAELEQATALWQRR